MKPFDFSPLKTTTRGAASPMPAISAKKILMAFWHNWPAGRGDGYQQGHSASLDLVDIPEEYNVIAVAFMKGRGIPTFKPYNLSDEEFRRQVGVLNSQGRVVLISLGGADAHIELSTGQEEPLAYEIIRLVETYGFDGLDIDLEQAAIDSHDNVTVLPAALKRVKKHYAAEGKNFIISMAPEFPYLTSDAKGKYVPYINALEDEYDFIAPQYYNQNGDGLWVAEANSGNGAWISQNNDELKEDFLYYLTESLVTGSRGFTYIPAHKFAIGLPSNIDAAANGYVIDPAAVENTLQRLEGAGKAIKGLMTWSVNWDGGENRDGVDYQWEFRDRYAPLIHGKGDSGDDEEKPSPPRSLSSPAQTETSVTLAWGAGVGTHPIEQYNVYRNGRAVRRTAGRRFNDTGLTPDTEYSYFVTAVDSRGVESLPSNSLTVRTAEASEADPPSAPTNLASPAQTETSVTLSWSAAVGTYPIERYTVYRNGSIAGETAGLGFEDQELRPDTEYNYFVTAVDSRGTESLPSSNLRVRTRREVIEPPDMEHPAWQVNRRYRVGDKVSYQGMTYRCIHEHTSNDGWTPAAAVTLWSEVVTADPDTPYPEWRPNRHYRKVDGVTYQGKKYICTQEHTSNPDWTPGRARTLWTEVVEFAAAPA